MIPRAVANVGGTLLVFVAISNAWGQIAKIQTLQIDAWARPGVGQFVPADDLTQHLVYELFITNWNDQDLRFKAVDVEDAATGKRLARFDSKAPPPRLTTALHAGTGRLLPAGRTTIMTLDVMLPLGASVPAAVRHRIEFESNPNLQLIRDDNSLTSELVSFFEPMPINRARPLVIEPPLRGGPWYCNNGIGAFTNHDYLGAFDNIARLYAAERFGCDLSRAGAQSDSNSYGALVFAVADGRVVMAVEGVPENTRVGDSVVKPATLTNRTLAGNQIVLEIGKGQYAYYAHLQTGSLRVKLGDRVHKGQPLAKVGNSGNATGPHLHFQVCNGPGPFSCDPVPYVYRSYWLSGHLAWNPKRTRRVEFQVPTNGSFITFSGPGDFGPLQVASRDPDWSFHDTVTQQFPLERSPRIEIKGVTGPIVIASVETRMADIKVERSAGTQRELDCFQTRIDHRADLITISNVQFSGRPGCGSVDSRQALTLQVPSDALLQLSNIYYSTVKITGPVGGVTAENIGGHVSIEAAGTVNLRNLGNGVSLGLGALTGSSTIESVFGDVELDQVPSGFLRRKTEDGFVLISSREKREGEKGAALSLKRIDGDIVVKPIQAGAARRQE